MARGLLNESAGDGEVLPNRSARGGFGLCGFGGRENRDSDPVQSSGFLHSDDFLFGLVDVKGVYKPCSGQQIRGTAAAS
jgi:hypothetical protein